MKDAETELNMKLLKGVMSVKEKFKMITGMQKGESIPINRFFIVWRDHTKMMQDHTKKAENILRKYALMMQRNTTLSMWANWKNAVTIIKDRRLQRRYDRIMHQLQQQKQEVATLMEQKDQLQQRRKKLQRLVNEQELQKKLGLFAPPQNILARQDFERQLETLNGIKTEFMALPGSINYVGSLMDNHHQDISKLFDEEIVLRWLKYQLKLILSSVETDYNRLQQKIKEGQRRLLEDKGESFNERFASVATVVKSLAAVKKLLSPKNRYSRSNSFSIKLDHEGSESFVFAVEEEETDDDTKTDDMMIEYLSPINKNDKSGNIGNFRTLKTIIEDVLNCDLDDFGEDFEGGKIWLILFYFLFDGANFESLKELLQLIKYSHPRHQQYHLVVDKVMTLYHQYLDVDNEFGCFINAGSLESNTNIMNFALLLQFIQAKPNMTLIAEHVEKYESEIKSTIYLVSTVMGRLTYDANTSLFSKESKSIENKIKKFSDRKKQLITQHRKWSEIQNRFDMRLLQELYHYKAGKLNFLYEPMYPHYVIKNIANIPFEHVRVIYRDISTMKQNEA